MKKTDSNGIIPTQGLLSDMESLVIYGGKGISAADPNGKNTFCGGANCKCNEKDPADGPVNTGDCNTYCGENTNCFCGKS